jgi:hypothetical protein
MESAAQTRERADVFSWSARVSSASRSISARRSLKALPRDPQTPVIA